MQPPSLLEQLVPGLGGQRIPLGTWPTPVRPLDVGGPEPLWCKDEGHSGHPYGGNKVRKLEWLLPRVDGRRAVVTFGAAGSNHVLATAVYARRLDVKVHAVLVPQPRTDAARRNAGVIARVAHRVWPAANEAAAAGALGRALAAARREDGRWPGVVWVGGSTPRGVLGWVDGALEIAAQVRGGDLPRPARVVVPVGSGGIAAGLLAGFALARLDTVVHAVRVAEPVWANRRTILLLARLAGRHLRAAGASLPALDPTRLLLDERWFGGVYGRPTATGEQAARVATGAGLSIESTYSAKALAAAIAAVRAGTGPVLWIDTANAHPLEPLVGGRVPEPPPAVDRLLTA